MTNFSTAAFGGFEKAEVLSYIQQLKAQHRDVIEHLNTQLDTQDQSEIVSDNPFNMPTEETSHCLKETEELQSQLDIAKEKNIQLHHENEVLVDKFLEYEKQSLENFAVSTELSDSELHKKIALLESEIAHLEESATMIGKVMLDTYSRADIMVREAEKEAANLIEDAKIGAEDIKEMAKNQIQQQEELFYEKVSEKVSEVNALIESRLKEVNHYVRYTVEDLSDISKEYITLLESQATTVESSFKDMQNTTKRYLEYTISKLEDTNKSFIIDKSKL